MTVRHFFRQLMTRRHADMKKQPFWGCFFECGAGGRNRTRDPLITSQVLYQLSYTGKKERIVAQSAPFGKQSGGNFFIIMIKNKKSPCESGDCDKRAKPERIISAWFLCTKRVCGQRGRIF